MSCRCSVCKFWEAYAARANRAKILQKLSLHEATNQTGSSIKVFFALANRECLKVKNDHRSKFSNLSNWKEEAWKKIRASTGFEPVTSALPVRCSTNWAMKPHIGSEVNLLSSYLPWGVKWCEVYEIIHIWIEIIHIWIFFQASSFQLLKLENLLRWSFFTFIYNRNSNMNYFIYFTSFHSSREIWTQ